MNTLFMEKASLCSNTYVKYKRTDALSMWHQRWTFTDPFKPEVRPGAREESASPAWLAAPAMNAHDTTKVYIWRLDI